MSDKNKKLYRAVESRDVSEVRRLLERGRLLQLGADVNYKNVNDYQKTPLHAAAGNGHLEVAELLLSKGAIVESANKVGLTPLHYTAFYGHLEVAKLLMSNGANIEASDINKRTPLHFAAENGKLEVVKYLVESGASLDVKNNDGNTALDIARKKGYQAVAVFVENWLKKYMPETIMGDTNAKLYRAVDSGDVSEVEKFLQLGADVNYTNPSNDNKTPLHCAAFHGHLEVAKLLLSYGYGADVRVVTKVGRTPLHFAVAKGHFEVAKLLLSYGADVEAADNNNSTPLHYAESNGDSEVAKLLQNAKPKTFFSLIFSLDSIHTESPDSLRDFLEQLARIVTNVHEMKLFYTLLRAILAQGLIQKDECAKKILHKALKMTAESCHDDDEVTVYKLILDKCFKDQMIDTFRKKKLKRMAENKNVEHQPFIQDMKAAIEKNTQDILELRYDVESVKNNIVILEKNIRSINTSVEDIRSALRFKQKVEAALSMLKVVINAVSQGSAGVFMDVVVGGIVDFGDVVHLQEMAENFCGEDAKSLMDGIDEAKENMGVLLNHTAELGANRMIGKRMEEALKKGDSLFVLGFVSVVISTKVSPNPKTSTMDDILKPETKIAECIFPDAILSEHDEKRLDVHATIKYGEKEDLEALLQQEEHLVSMNEKDSEGRTAADLAALTGQMELWTILIEKGGKHEFESKPKMKKKVQNRNERSSQYLDWIEKQCT